MIPLRIIAGDATNPHAKGPKIIAHVCNDLGGWGKGFVMAISRRWPEPGHAYRQWHHERAGNDFSLGATQLVQVQPDIWVANMIAGPCANTSPSCADCALEQVPDPVIHAVAGGSGVVGMPHACPLA